MYKNNWSLQRIADEICLHSKTIKKILILKGIQIRSSNLAFQLSHKNKKHLLEIATNGRKEGIGLKYDNRNKMEVIK